MTKLTLSELRNVPSSAAEADFIHAEGFALMERMATVLAGSCLVPEEYRAEVTNPETRQIVKNPAALSNCLTAMCAARRLCLDPFTVMQGLRVKNGRTTWSDGLLLAALESSGRFARPEFELSETEEDEKASPLCAVRNETPSGMEHCDKAKLPAAGSTRLGGRAESDRADVPEHEPNCKCPADTPLSDRTGRPAENVVFTKGSDALLRGSRGSRRNGEILPNADAADGPGRNEKGGNIGRNEEKNASVPAATHAEQTAGRGGTSETHAQELGVCGKVTLRCTIRAQEKTTGRILESVVEAIPEEIATFGHEQHEAALALRRRALLLFCRLYAPDLFPGLPEAEERPLRRSSAETAELAPRARVTLAEIVRQTKRSVNASHADSETSTQKTQAADALRSRPAVTEPGCKTLPAAPEKAEGETADETACNQNSDAPNAQNNAPAFFSSPSRNKSRKSKERS